MHGRIWHPDPADPPVPTQRPLPAIGPDDFEDADEVDWDALERHARALDRSEAAHHLRVRHHQAARAQAHVRTAVGW